MVHHHPGSTQPSFWPEWNGGDANIGVLLWTLDHFARRSFARLIAEVIQHSTREDPTNRSSFFNRFTIPMIRRGDG